MPMEEGRITDRGAEADITRGNPEVAEGSGRRARVREVRCVSALSRSRLTGLDYALNPYRGCEHGCLYCYSPAVIHCDEREPWGEWVEARVNMPVLLSRELRRLPRGTVGVGTVTDPYQPAELRYRVTRHCLEQLLRHQWPVCIQTKSRNVVEDIGLLSRFKNIEVGFTLTTADDGLRGAFEPRASSVGERLGALAALRDAGVPTFVFFGPVLPGAVEKGLEGLFRSLAELSIRRILIDRLRVHRGVWERLRPYIAKSHPALVAEYEAILFGLSEDYERLILDIVELARACGLSAAAVGRP
ncbi:MAG: radical SAM protein [Thermoplasmata archaeon]